MRVSKSAASVLVGRSVGGAHNVCRRRTNDVEDLFAFKIMESGEVGVRCQMLTQSRQLFGI